MTPDVVADTNAILWWYFDPPRLSPPARQTLTTAIATGRLYISAVTLVELVYLEGRSGFPYPGAFGRVSALVADPVEALEILPVTVQVAAAMFQVARAEVPDMPDRIIAATAVAHNLPLVSSDTDIRGSATLNSLIPVIW